jgi:hypothetical protein
VDTTIPALASKAALDAAKKEGASFLRALYGEPTKELSLLFSDKISARRFHNLLKTVGKANQWYKETGISPKQVPLKILHPLLENCSLEEEETMQDRWAALLANAANPSLNMTILPGFLDALRQLNPHEAAFLDMLCSEPIPKHHVFSLARLDLQEIMIAWESAAKGMSQDLLQLTFDNLARLGFFRIGMELSSVQPGSISSLTQFTDLADAKWITTYEFTDFGRQFLLACHAPAPKSPA